MQRDMGEGAKRCAYVEEWRHVSRMAYLSSEGGGVRVCTCEGSCVWKQCPCVCVCVCECVWTRRDVCVCSGMRVCMYARDVCTCVCVCVCVEGAHVERDARACGTKCAWGMCVCMCVCVCVCVCEQMSVCR